MIQQTLFDDSFKTSSSGGSNKKPEPFNESKTITDILILLKPSPKSRNIYEIGSKLNDIWINRPYLNKNVLEMKDNFWDYCLDNFKLEYIDSYRYLKSFEIITLLKSKGLNNNLPSFISHIQAIIEYEPESILKLWSIVDKKNKVTTDIIKQSRVNLNLVKEKRRNISLSYYQKLSEYFYQKSVMSYSNDDVMQYKREIQNLEHKISFLKLENDLLKKSSSFKTYSDYATPKTKTPYDILGLKHNSNKDDIKKAFRELSKTYHPDLNRNLPSHVSELINQKFIEVKNAYESLIKYRT